MFISFSDECTESQFECDDGRCMPSWRVCDLENDCGNFEDEQNCTCRFANYRALVYIYEMIHSIYSHYV